MKRQGFTIVELVITITIMAILLVLSVADFSDTQINSRDSERKLDIETIANNLEVYYTSGTDGSTSIGKYPSTSAMTGLSNQQTALRDVNIKNLIAPSAPSDTITSLVVATNNTQTVAGVLPQPQAATDQNQYVYQPIQQNGALCNAAVACQKFNLYYVTEIDNVVHKVTSKNQ